jgi:hypothetical protein
MKRVIEMARLGKATELCVTGNHLERTDENALASAIGTLHTPEEQFKNCFLRCLNHKVCLMMTMILDKVDDCKRSDYV